MMSRKSVQRIIFTCKRGLRSKRMAVRSFVYSQFTYQFDRNDLLPSLQCGHQHGQVAEGPGQVEDSVHQCRYICRTARQRDGVEQCSWEVQRIPSLRYTLQ